MVLIELRQWHIYLQCDGYFDLLHGSVFLFCGDEVAQVFKYFVFSDIWNLSKHINTMEIKYKQSQIT